MTYNEAISYLYDRLPVFHRVGVSAYKPGLANVLSLCQALGNPQHQFRTIHVAGTNGKGSTSHMLASIYQSAGYRVGLYTSPHLKSFTERIRLNGHPIPEAVVADFVEAQRLSIEQIQPSFFEVTVAMAFDYFAREQVDLAIIEVGLGGRLDSTNIITPIVSVITNIGWDHVDVLGDTLPKIAAEKGGIIKPNVPVVIGERHEETEFVFRSIAAVNEAPIEFAEDDWTVVDRGLTNGFRQVDCVSRSFAETYSIDLPLLGIYQLANVKTVLATIQRAQSFFSVSNAAILDGCRLVVTNTGLKGRFQWIQQRPILIADTAHNKPGIDALLTSIRTIAYAHLRIVVGFVRDKDVLSILNLLPADAIYYFCQADSPRAFPVEELVQQASSVGLLGQGYQDVNVALAAALAEATPDDLILITGSTYVVAEVNSL
ncbi:bifunctional folylpolyglutamate synthase/dihydrofolate synthase [Fibrivirga algicola]|uniref:Dihydrofolate synthase/folylpolyglutamate synthase n=1 Tax=Fibrivirga algicola TaxID=2950420 RepID=A0ABX0QPB0_9BACT|nr:folylpolyglutamate synthase/dihydrofolate synthase family protein [Fibrivirga algicola]NID12438.1 bifunctional folylpolyglutamate synthase/dihydrofolate synthase [Fibrivirga algicola]